MSNFTKASRESTRDLLLDMKINNIATKSVPKKETSPMIHKFKRHSNKPITTSTSYTGDLAIKDMVLDSEIDKIANIASNVKQPVNAKIISPVTQQMIDEARAEAKAPITVNGVNYRYRPTSLPEPNLVTGTLNQTLTENEKQQIQIDKGHAVQQINLDNDAIKHIDEALKQLDEQFNIDKIEFDKYSRELNNTFLKELKQEHPDIGKRNKFDSVEYLLHKKFGTSNMLKSYNDAVTRLNGDRTRISHNILTIESDIEAMNRRLIQDQEEVKQNEAIDYSVRKQNAEMLNAYASDLNALNKGMFNIEQASGESDEDYRQRLIQTGQETIPDEEIRISAGLSNSVKAKYNLQQVLDDKGKIETIIKMLTDDEKFLFNKQFPKIKKVFVDTYGINNKSVSEQDAVELIRDVLASPIVPQASVQGPIQGQTEAPLSVSATPLILGGPKQKLLQYINYLQSQGSAVRTPPTNFNIIEIIKMLEDQKVTIPDDILDDVNKKTIDELHQQGLIQYYTLGPPQTRRPVKAAPVVEPVAPAAPTNDLSALFAKRREPPPLEPASIPWTGRAKKEPVALPPPPKGPSMMEELAAKMAKIRAANNPEASLTGIGIPHYPKLMNFGKVMISPDKLFYNNILIIRSHTGKPLTGLVNTKVSDVMVSILMKALEGHKISKSEINLLSSHEKQLYDNLMYMSGGHKIHEHSIDKTSQEMKHRLELIEGELEAGNNSELLKKELHSLLHKMAHNGLITLNSASKHYKALKEYYF